MKGFGTTKAVTMKQLVEDRGWMDSLQFGALALIPTLAGLLRFVPIDKLKPYKAGLIAITKFVMMLWPEEFEVKERKRA